MINRRTFLKFTAATPALILLPKLVEAKITPEANKVVDKLLYLEVSPRQSGKTTRLVAHMKEYIDRTGKDVYLISGNDLMLDNIVKLYVPKKYQHKVLRLPHESKKRRDIRYYYDEADFVPPEQQSFRRDAYYVGTPRGKTGYLYKLVKFNNMQYKKYEHNIREEALNNLKEHLNTKEFNREVYGKFS